MSNPIGRPSVFTQQIADEICLRMTEGESLRQVCESAHIPSRSAIMRWLMSEDEMFAHFKDQYSRARDALMDYWGDQIIEISDDTSHDTITKINKKGEEFEAENTEWINRSRLRVDSRKWLMSKLAAKKYGDKQQIEHSANESMTAVLQVVAKDKKE